MSVSLKSLLQIDALPAETANLAVTGLSSDSRAVKPGDLFFALSGSKADGMRFVPEAIARGAVAVVSEQAAPQSSGQAPVIRDANPRRTLALAAARFHGVQPGLCVAVTGTNGKTSVAAFVRQLWQAMGFRAASLGTIGVVGPEGERYLGLTTPDPVELHAILARLAGEERVTHLALEASSHGLAQHRIDGVRLAAGAFTNITRDHLDYHPTFTEYFAAKLRLFGELLPAGAPAVVNADAPQAEVVTAVAAGRGLAVFSVGARGDGLQLLSARRQGFGQRLEIRGRARVHSVALPLVGDFQASNALVAAGLVIATGGDEERVLEALETITGARGRLERVAETEAGAPVFVDYAHTPDALENVLKSLRPYVGRKLAVVFGAGGDRDQGKRPQMGKCAALHADVAYVTDDNPRSEDPARIRAQILAAHPGAVEIADRSQAIRTAVDNLEAGDVLLVAGKGHETGQIVSGVVKPFSDHEVVRKAIGVRHGR
ncbi:MAG: UDP-N-acetylmuramoyl-L-alanyl-D-glutamate--2,6-diaminopimelate ligase [Pseudomonadota bacterium]|nr:UDP-N-acetylmuramoyl-L-alanyl-D-glutamate--2,6-diaminopimelate ligase [Pseudomonadota bacterium]